MRRSKTMALALALCALLGLETLARAAVTAQDALAGTGAYIQETVKSPEVGSIGGEWAVIGLARSGLDVPESWYGEYLGNLRVSLEANGGVLSASKYTEYARAALALTALGEDPESFGGYDLLEKLGDFAKVTRQGVAGAAFTLIALDSGGYQEPVCAGAAEQTTRDKLLSWLLSRQLSDGGFSVGGETADPDATAIVLQALAPYAERDDVGSAADRALRRLSALQGADGTFSAGGEASAESSAQAVVALTALGLNPDADSLFVKNGHSALGGLIAFYMPGGGFRHLSGDAEADAMASEQGLYALASYARFLAGENALYDMGDAVKIDWNASRDPDVRCASVTRPGASFSDISASSACGAIEALAEREILNGSGGGLFEPARTLTRAEYAAAIVRALGFEGRTVSAFADVAEGSWYAPYVGAAYAKGIAAGVTVTEFCPAGEITREQAAVMTARAARLCGLDTAVSGEEAQDILARCPDGGDCSAWAEASLAFCCASGILPENDGGIRPKEAVTREETAEMIYKMLLKAGMI